MMALPRGAAHRLDGLGRRFGELVDIGARAGARALAGDRRHDFTVVHLATRDTAATIGIVAWPPGHHVHVQASRWSSPLTTGMQYGPMAAASGRPCGCRASAQECVVLHVGAGAGGVEHEVDVLEDRQARQAFDPFMRGGHAQARRAARPSDCGSMPTIAPISMCWPWRRILIIKSVPMLPLPMMAALSLRWAVDTWLLPFSEHRRGFPVSLLAGV